MHITYSKLLRQTVTGRDIAASIFSFIEEHKIKTEKLTFVGGDATASNSGPVVSNL